MRRFSISRFLFFLFFSLFSGYVFLVQTPTSDICFRRLKSSLELEFIPPSPPAITPRILAEPVHVVIDATATRENPEALTYLDGLLRLLAGNPNIAVAGIYGISSQRLANYLRSNVAHGPWRGMEVKVGDGCIFLNGVRINVNDRPLERGDIEDDKGHRLVDGVWTLSETVFSFANLEDFKNKGGFVIGLAPSKPETLGLSSALEVITSLGAKRINTVRIIEPGGSRQIDLTTEREDLTSYLPQHLRAEEVGDGVKIDRVSGGVENGGKHILIQFEVGESVTAEDINRAFQQASEGPFKGRLYYADKQDIIASGRFIDVDSGQRYAGPAFVFDSRLTKVNNGVVTIQGWTSDYAVAKAIIDSSISYGLKSRDRAQASEEGFIPPVQREGARPKIVQQTIRVAVNGGGGRIGTAMLISMIGNPNFNPVAIVGIRNPEELANMLRQDSARGHIYADIQAVREGGKQYIVINGKRILCLGRMELSELPWEELGIEYAVDATGKFLKREQLEGYLEAGASKVGLTAPPKSKDIPQLVPGVNQQILLDNPGEIISFASCTTNNVTTALYVVGKLLGKFGIVPRLVHIQTIHAVTKKQPVLDGQNTKPTDEPEKALKSAERGRAAPDNIIVTSTGAEKAAPAVLSSVLGWPKDIFVAEAVRVGNQDGSVSALDIILPQKCPFTAEELRQAFKEAAERALKGILYFNDSQKPLNSRAILMQEFTSIVESSQIEIEGNTIHLKTWYDNEWGYTQQVIKGLLMMRLVEENPDISEEELLEAIHNYSG